MTDRNITNQETDEEIRRLNKNKRLLEIFDRTDIWEFEEAAKIAEARKKREKEIIQNCIKEGLSNELIARLTEVNEQEIEKIRKKYLAKLKKKSKEI